MYTHQHTNTLAYDPESGYLILKDNSQTLRHNSKKYPRRKASRDVHTPRLHINLITKVYAVICMNTPHTLSIEFSFSILDIVTSISCVAATHSKFQLMRSIKFNFLK